MPRTVLGTLVPRVRSASGRHGSCPWSRKAGAGSLTSPDAVPKGALSARDARRVVTGGLAGLRGEGLAPVLRAPLGGVGRVHDDDGDPQLGGHADQSGPQSGDGHAGDQLAEPLSPAVFLTRLLRLEAEVLDRDAQPVPARPVRRCTVGPLLAPVTEHHRPGKHVPAVPAVGQMRQWGRELDRDLAVRGDTDRLVPVPLAGLAVGGEEPACGLPLHQSRHQHPHPPPPPIRSPADTPSGTSRSPSTRSAWRSCVFSGWSAPARPAPRTCAGSSC